MVKKIKPKPKPKPAPAAPIRVTPKRTRPVRPVKPVRSGSEEPVKPGTPVLPAEPWEKGRCAICHTPQRGVLVDPSWEGALYCPACLVKERPPF